jgi:putative membrane protein
MKFITKLIISTFAVIITVKLLPGVYINGLSTTNRFITALLVAVVLAFLNSVVKPILVFLTIPVTIFTLGLFYLVLNALMVILAGKLVSGFVVEGLFWALFFSIILSIVTSLLELIFGTNRREKE